MYFVNRQRVRSVDLRLLRRIAKTLIVELLQRKESHLGICLVEAQEISCLNEKFLGHRGPTDVITFDYAAGAKHRSGRAAIPGALPAPLFGEILLCVDAACGQAKRFRTTWQSELVRYLVHGVLHLLGYDDASSTQRNRMKRQEDFLVRTLAARYNFAQLARFVPQPRNPGARIILSAATPRRGGAVSSRKAG